MQVSNELSQVLVKEFPGLMQNNQTSEPARLMLGFIRFSPLKN